MPAPNAFIFKKRLELLWQQSITSWGCRPGVICGLLLTGIISLHCTQPTAEETELAPRDPCHPNIWFLVSQVLFVFDRDISSRSDAYMM